MSYGANGNTYYVGGNPIQVDDKFFLSTIMALTMILTENLPEFKDNQTDLFDMVEYLASRIYEAITENEPDNAGNPTDEPAE